MGFGAFKRIDPPRDEVFARHAGPGAFVRLLPPLQPMRAIAEAAALQHGRAELALPGVYRSPHAM